MGNNFTFELGDMPPIGWAFLIGILFFLLGMLFSFVWMKTMGIIILALTGIAVIIGIIAMIVDAFR